MQLDLQGSAVAGRAAVRRHVEQRALFEFARYGERVATVRMRVVERPPSSAHRYHCGVAVTLVQDDGAPTHVLSRSEGDDAFRLIEAVLARASSLAGGEIERAAAAQAAREQWMAAAEGGPRKAS